MTRITCMAVAVRSCWRGVRAKPRAPVATPLRWDELSDPRLKPDRWTVKSIGDRIEAEGDPWQGMSRRARALPG